MPALANDPPWLKAAYKDLGLREIGGPKASARIVKMYALAGHPEVKSDEVAWCAAAVGAWLAEAGSPNTGSLAARSYLDYGRKLSTSKNIPRGAIVVFKRGTGWQGHVGLCVDDKGDVLKVIGGNQSDAVGIANYKRSGLLGARWPHVKAPPAPPPDVEPIAPSPPPQRPPSPPDVEPVEPEPKSFGGKVKKWALGWLSGGGATGLLAYLTDWKVVVAITVCGLAVAGVVWLFFRKAR